MAVSWTPHRFSGGVLALDVANTVVMRGDPQGFDRFADRSELARFAKAACVFRAVELEGRGLEVADAQAIAPTIIDIRETTDRLFRANALDGEMSGADLSPFLTACAEGLRGSSIAIGGARGGRTVSALPLQAAVAVSALSLLSRERCDRIRICANCRWLFLDASRNRSRVWCDMAVCGNRQKAKRHYNRGRSRGEKLDA